MAPGKVKWDTKEMPVRHSEYVDVVHARFLALLDGLEQMRVLGLPASVRTLLVRGAGRRRSFRTFGKTYTQFAVVTC